MKNRALVLTAFAALQLCSCQFGLEELFYREHDVTERATRLTEVVSPPVSSPSRYTFAVITDPHMGSSASGYYLPEAAFFSSITGTVNDRPSFLIVLGDVAETGSAGEYAQFAAFMARFTDTCAIPWYGVVGNHDLFNSGWNTWSQTIRPGTSYYRFAIGSRSFYFLDTGNGTLGQPQLEDLESAMKADGRSKMVFTHYPLFGGIGFSYFKLTNTRERIQLIQLFANSNVDAYFAGHWHPGASHNYSCFFEKVFSTFFAEDGRPGRWAFVTIDEDQKTLTMTTWALAGEMGGTTASTEVVPLSP